MTSVRFALLGDDPHLAQEHLLLDMPFDYHSQEYELLQVLSELPVPPPVVDDPTVIELFDRFFDWVRDPELQAPLDRDMVRFEFGILREKYFMSHDGYINWRRVLDMISQ